MLSFFFHFYANVQPNVTYGIYYYTTTEFDYTKRDSGLAVYEGLCLESQLFLYFVNKIYLPCYCVVFFVVCQLLRLI